MASLLEALGNSMILRSVEDPIDLLDPEACIMETSSVFSLETITHNEGEGATSNDDFAAQARQMIAQINVLGFNKLALMDLWQKGKQLVTSKDNHEVTLEGNNSRLNRKMFLSRAATR